MTYLFDNHNQKVYINFVIKFLIIIQIFIINITIQSKLRNKFI